MPTVFIPMILRQYTAGAARVPAAGATLRAVLGDLERQHPALQGQVLEDGVLRPELFIAIGAEEAFGLDVPVAEAAEVHILPAIAGGSPEGDDGAELAALCHELRIYRQAARLTQGQIARAVGTSQARISRIESGGEIPRLDLLVRLCRQLDVQLRVVSGRGTRAGAS